MRVASFFAGIGGFDLGFERAGMEVAFQCEIDPFCQRVLEKHWPNVQRHSDIEQLFPNNIPEADLYCGGFPCQDVSLANQGKRQGLKGARSGLFFKFADLVGANKPRWVVLENVPGLLNSQDGKDFRMVIGTLAEFGYGVAWRVFDAKYFGTSQRRRRVFIVASYNSRRALEVLFDNQTSPFIVEEGRRQEATFTNGSGTRNKTSNLYSIQHAAVGRKHTAGPQGIGYRNDGETWTFDNRGDADVICATNDPFRVRETSGLPRGMDKHRYQVLGNAVCVHVIEWIGNRILAAEFADNDKP